MDLVLSTVCGRCGANTSVDTQTKLKYVNRCLDYKLHPCKCKASPTVKVQDTMENKLPGKKVSPSFAKGLRGNTVQEKKKVSFSRCVSI